MLNLSDLFTFDTLSSLLAMLVAPLTAAALILALSWRWSRIWSRSQPLLEWPLRWSFGRLFGRRYGGMASLGEVVMTPLEADLTQAPTFVTLPVATPPAAPPSAFPTYKPPSLPAIPPSIPPSIPPVGSSLAVLDSPRGSEGGVAGEISAMSDIYDDPDWPPLPRVPGATTYRYVLASGELVRLRGLRRMGARPLVGHELN